MEPDKTYEVTILRDGHEVVVRVRSNCIENAIDKATTPTLYELLEDRCPELIGARVAH